MSKIIDKNGKLFGKINLLDLLIFLVIAVVLIGGIYKIFFVDDSVYTPDYKEGEITIKIASLTGRQSEALAEGDLVYVPKIQDLGTIVKLDINNKTDNVSSADGKVYTVKNPLLYEAVIVLRSEEMYEKNGEIYVGQNYNIKSGMTLNVSNGVLPSKASIISTEIK